MTLPDHEKTWQFDVNNLVTGANVGLQNTDLMFQVKQCMVSFPINPWTVVSSSNSIMVANGDLWTAASNLLWAQLDSVAHSWIVLKQTGLGLNFQLLINLVYINGQGKSTENIQLCVSPNAGFAGGLITARPTATDEVILFTNTTYGAYNPSSSDEQNPVVHAMQTTDGYCTRIYGMENGIPTDVTPVGNPSLAWCFERIKNPLPEIENEWVFNLGKDTSVSYTGMDYLADSLNMRTIIDGVSAQVTYSAEGASGLLPDDNAMLRPNDISGEYQAFEAGFCVIDHQNRGRIGSLYDFYLCPNSLHLNYFPDASGNPRKWIALNNVLVPWDGSTTIILSG